MEVNGRDDPSRHKFQDCTDFPISVPRHQVFDIDIHGDDGDADRECELNFQARSLESTCPEEMSTEGKMEGKNTQTDKQPHDTQTTFMLHTDMGTMTASSHVGEPASSGDLPLSVTTPASTGDAACAHLLERAGSQGRYCDCAYSAAARHEHNEHATDGDSFRRSHCATAGGHTLHSAPSLRHTTSNCHTATSAATNCSSAKDLVVDSVSRYKSLPLSSCSNAAALFILLAPVYMFVLFPRCFFPPFAWRFVTYAI